MQAGQALEHFHLLFVFQGDVLLAGDGAAVDLVAARGVQREAAHHEVFVVADRRIAVAYRGVVAQHFAEQAGLLVLDQGGVDHADRGGGVQQRRFIETADRGGVTAITGLILALDLHRRQFNFRSQTAADATAEQQAEGET